MAKWRITAVQNVYKPNSITNVPIGCQYKAGSLERQSADSWNKVNKKFNRLRMAKTNKSAMTYK